jgi:hypothetical protein
MEAAEQVRRLAMENLQWVRALEVACDVATEKAEWRQFAGTEVIKRLLASGELELPNLTPLVAYGLLVKVGDSARGGKRAYCWVPDLNGVSRAIGGVKRDHERDGPSLWLRGLLRLPGPDYPRRQGALWRSIVRRTTNLSSRAGLIARPQQGKPALVSWPPSGGASGTAQTDNAK